MPVPKTFSVLAASEPLSQKPQISEPTEQVPMPLTSKNGGYTTVGFVEYLSLIQSTEMDSSDRNTLQRIEQDQKKILDEITKLKRMLKDIMDELAAISAGR
jgi:hypothetical protein